MKPSLLLTAAALCAQALSWSTLPARAAEPPPGDSITLRVAPDHDLIYRKGPREVVVQVEVEGCRPKRARHTPLNLSFVLDRSGSMAGAKIEKARQAAEMAVDRLEDDDVFSLVIYDDSAEVLIAPDKVGSRDRREDLKQRIRRIQPGGSTALYDGVQLGSRQVRKFLADERVNRVILLSDGIANQGPSSPRELAKLGRELREGGLSVTTIGVGDDFNEDLMTALAEASHANYYYVKDAEKLPGIFTEELGAAGTKIAADVKIRIEVPEGVRVQGILGHPDIKPGAREIQIALPELFGAERRLYHVVCALEGETATEALSLANVTLKYDDTVAKRPASQVEIAKVRVTDDAAKAGESVKAEVAQNVNSVRNRLDKEQAVKLADEGRAAEGAQLLRSRAAANVAAPAPQQIRGVKSENESLEKIAEELSREGGLSKATRKGAQWENYQDRNQKR